ncbi:hypothetical protein BJ742DRAFT_444677 [Cladochytrium replicatum]|nr:hypothetical protein BJ742DRAFT_444677 [Cladochytrium replicatum]
MRLEHAKDVLQTDQLKLDLKAKEELLGCLNEKYSDISKVNNLQSQKLQTLEEENYCLRKVLQDAEAKLERKDSEYKEKLQQLENKQEQSAIEQNIAQDQQLSHYTSIIRDLRDVLASSEALAQKQRIEFEQKLAEMQRKYSMDLTSIASEATQQLVLRHQVDKGEIEQHAKNAKAAFLELEVQFQKNFGQS